MALVRYGTNVCEIDGVYGLGLYRKGTGRWRLKVVLRGGTESFEMRFESEQPARQAFDTICGELDVRDLAGGADGSVKTGPETSQAHAGERQSPDTI